MFLMKYECNYYITDGFLEFVVFFSTWDCFWKCRLLVSCTCGYFQWQKIQRLRMLFNTSHLVSLQRSIHLLLILVCLVRNTPA